MAFTQGEVIELKGHKIVFIRNRIKKYLAVELNDPTHSYTCLGGYTTGEFRQDVVDDYLAYELEKETKKKALINESLKYKSLEIGRAVVLTDKREVFIIRHKRTKFIGMSSDGQLWDVNYAGIESELDYGIESQTEEIKDLFSETLRTV